MGFFLFQENKSNSQNPRSASKTLAVPTLLNPRCESSRLAARSPHLGYQSDQIRFYSAVLLILIGLLDSLAHTRIWGNLYNVQLEINCFRDFFITNPATISPRIIEIIPGVFQEGQNFSRRVKIPGVFPGGSRFQEFSRSFPGGLKFQEFSRSGGTLLL